MSAIASGMPQWVGWVYGAITAVAALTDYRQGKIYNWLTLPAIVLGIAAALWFGGTGTEILALEGLGVAAIVFVPLFFLGVFGAGDAKLMMALGTVLGPWGALQLTAACILVAGAGSVVLLFRHGRVRIFSAQIWAFFRTLVTPGLSVQMPKLSRDIKAPFGVAIFIGFLCVMIGGGA